MFWISCYFRVNVLCGHNLIRYFDFYLFNYFKMFFVAGDNGGINHKSRGSNKADCMLEGKTIKIAVSTIFINLIFFFFLPNQREYF